MSSVLWEGEGKIDESLLKGLSPDSTPEQRAEVSLSFLGNLLFYRGYLPHRVDTNLFLLCGVSCVVQFNFIIGQRLYVAHKGRPYSMA
jgi:hypothetical protein